MKKTYFTLLILIASVFSGCQNDGHLGALFGSWVLTEMKIDGIVTEDYYPTTFSFQNDIVQVTRHVDSLTAYRSFGTWKRSGDIMDFDFRHSNDDGDAAYLAPTWLGFKAGGVTTVTVTHLNNSHFDFTQTADDGRVYTYKFDRTW